MEVTAILRLNFGRICVVLALVFDKGEREVRYWMNEASRHASYLGLARVVHSHCL
jgi:hypothetical protein